MASVHKGLKEIEAAIHSLDKEDQGKLIHHLPHLLDIKIDDLALLHMAESSFDFWDNPEDAEYDSL